MSIRVLRPGILMTVQDRGRHGWQHVGLCPGGAMDPLSLALGNAMVGNDADAAALELTVLGPELLFEADTLVALGGAEFDTSLPLRRGDAIPLRPDAEALSKERFAKLRKPSGRSVRWSAPPFTAPDREPIVLHVMEGQHFTAFDTNAQRAFFDTIWRVAPESNRMGFRLAGAPLSPVADEILSGPTCLGSVQVPANGTPIALMADHQTTGGYPRIAEIAAADVPRLAQLAPGGSLHFARCSLETALDLRRHSRTRLESALRGIAFEYGK